MACVFASSFHLAEEVNADKIRLDSLVRPVLPSLASLVDFKQVLRLLTADSSDYENKASFGRVRVRFESVPS